MRTLTVKREEELGEEVAMEELDHFMLRLVLLAWGKPCVGVVLVEVVVEHVVSSVRELPGVEGHEDGPMCDVSEDVVEPLVLREVGVAAVMSHHKDAPHEEAGDVPVRQGGNGLLPKSHLGPESRLDQLEHSEEGASPHGVVKEHVCQGLEEILLEGLGGNGLHDGVQLQRLGLLGCLMVRVIHFLQVSI